MNDNNVDIVVPYVDCNDVAWRDEAIKYNILNDKNEYMFRDWGFLKYWFRGIEKNLPWIHKVYLILYGNAPEWLNLNNQKLVVVKHKDYIPNDYLPTFSSHTIELNLHRIENLSETFIYSNDDTIFLDKMNKEDYFIDSLPCDYVHIRPVTESNSKYFKHILLNNLSIINKHFSFDMMENKNNILFSEKYSKEILDDNKSALRYRNICGFVHDHMPIPLLKSMISDIWQKEYKYLHNVCLHKVRNPYKDVNIYLIRYFQLLSGKFTPYIRYKGKYMRVTDSCENIEKNINVNNKIICLNDSDECENFNEKVKFIVDKLNNSLGEKSTFEL